MMKMQKALDENLLSIYSDALLSNWEENDKETELIQKLNSKKSKFTILNPFELQ